MIYIQTPGRKITGAREISGTFHDHVLAFLPPCHRAKWMLHPTITDNTISDLCRYRDVDWESGKALWMDEPARLQSPVGDVALSSRHGENRICLLPALLNFLHIESFADPYLALSGQEQRDVLHDVPARFPRWTSDPEHHLAWLRSLVERPGDGYFAQTHGAFVREVLARLPIQKLHEVPHLIAIYCPSAVLGAKLPPGVRQTHWASNITYALWGNKQISGDIIHMNHDTGLLPHLVHPLIMLLLLHPADHWVFDDDVIALLRTHFGAWRRMFLTRALQDHLERSHPQALSRLRDLSATLF